MNVDRGPSTIDAEHAVNKSVTFLEFEKPLRGSLDAENRLFRYLYHSVGARSRNICSPLLRTRAGSLLLLVSDY
jgi:hypothetical protein